MAGAPSGSGWKVLVADDLAPDGLERLRRQADVVEAHGRSPAEVREAMADADAVIVRSRTRMDAGAIAAAPRLRVIARAGVGIDNIDVDAATRRGIVVLNAPESSTTSTAEHTMAMILAAARSVASAHAATSAGLWQRDRFTGIELYGKTLGVVGLGKIGTEVARRAAAFGMRVVAFDPYISEERGRGVGVELLPWEAVLEQSDVLTLHLPLLPETRHLIGPEALARMRPSVVLVNCARGGLVDEAALLAALEEGRVARAALDVFEREPPDSSLLLSHPRVTVTPHLGASTAEAQRLIAVEVAEQVLDALAGRPTRGAVNLPAVAGEQWTRLLPFARLMRILGVVARQLAAGQIRGVECVYEGEVAGEDTRILAPVLLAGLLEAVSDEPVNPVNAAIVARQRGIELSEVHRPHGQDFTSLIRVRLLTSVEPLELGGTLFGRHEPRITHLGDYRIDLAPAPHMLFVWNLDRPGMIGRVGTILGRHGVNIAGMQVGRVQPGGTAVMVLLVDSPLPPAALNEVGRADGIAGVRPVAVDPGLLDA